MDKNEVVNLEKKDGLNEEIIDDNLEEKELYIAKKLILEHDKTLPSEAMKETTLLNLPREVLERIFSYLSSNDIIIVSSVSKYFQCSVQTVKKSFDFTAYYTLNTKSLLEYTLSTTCTSINLNHCYWLKPSTIHEIITKTKLEHIHVIECDVDQDCIEAICDLDLISLSFTYNLMWKSYFGQRLNDSINCFKSMENLEIFYRGNRKEDEYLAVQDRPNIICEINEKIIHRCQELLHLKVTETKRYPFQCLYERQQPSFLITTTPVPKLKSLIFDLHNVLNLTEQIVGFVQMILKDKVTPLEHVDLGVHTFFLFKDGILSDPRILMDKSTLLLRNLHFWLNFEGIQNLISQSGFKKVVIHRFGKIDESESGGTCKFVKKVVSNSQSTLKEIDIDFGSLDNHMDCVPFIAINCPQITVLDLSFLNNTLYPIDLPTTQYHKNETMLEAISNLSNLRKLVINYFLLEFNRNTRPPSFYKVTQGCKQLTELGIVDPFGDQIYDDLPIIYEEILYDIVHCKKLKVLKLRMVKIVGSREEFDLSQITKSCEQLQELCLTFVYGINDRSLDHSLIYAKNLKTLRLLVNFELAISQAFFDNLSQCEHLERFYCYRENFEDAHCQNVVDAVVKLKNLQAFWFDSETLNSASKNYIADEFKKVVEERPAFFSNFSMTSQDETPEIHRQLINWLNFI